MNEFDLMREIQIKFSNGSVRLLRNNIGSLKDKTGRWVKFGLANPGGSDLIGWTSVVITPDMVGRKVAVFLAIETKGAKSRTTPEQIAFIEQVVFAGGRGAIVRTTEEAKHAICGQ